MKEDLGVVVGGVGDVVIVVGGEDGDCGFVF